MSKSIITNINKQLMYLFRLLFKVATSYNLVFQVFQIDRYLVSNQTHGNGSELDGYNIHTQTNYKDF